MTKRTMTLILAALLAVPMFALAQHVVPVAAAARPEAPAVAPTADRDAEWGEDDLFAFAFGDEESMVASDEEGGPGGDRKVIRERIVSGPGAEGGMPDMMMMHGAMGGVMHGGRRGGAGMHQMMMARFAQLDLSDVQRDKMRDIHEGMMRKNIQRQADLKLAMLDLHKAMSSDKPEPTAVNSQIDKVARLRADGMKAHFDAMMQAKAVLTPEQWKKVHSGGPMGGRMGGGPGKMHEGGMGHDQH